jgi:hypothetical protein
MARGFKFIGVIGVIFIAAIVFELWFVPIYGEICSKNEYTGAKDCAAYNVILVILWHISKALNDHGVAITTLATIAIAGFTWTLKRSTDKLWDASKKQTKLTKRLFAAEQRPWVSVELTPDPNGRLTVTAGHVRVDIKISYRNHGLTPALKVILGNVTVLHDETEIERTQERKRTTNLALLKDGTIGIALFPGPPIEFDSFAEGAVPPDAFHTTIFISDSTPDALFLVGCLTYESPSGRAGVTSFCFQVGERNSSGLFTGMKHRVGASIACSRLEFSKNNVGNNAT